MSIFSAWVCYNISMVFTWAFRRQILYVVILLLILGAFGLWVVYPYFNKLPSCADGIRNGDEAGVDCGGSCARACLYQVDQVSVLWARAFQVVPGRYNAVAYLENHNSASAIRKISYEFRFADKDNLYIGRRDGVTTIPASGRFAVFEPGLDFGNSAPVYVTFRFTQTPDWLQVPKERLDNVKLLVSDISLSGEKSSPLLSAQVANDSLFILPDVKVIAILYDKNGNAVTASSTYISELAAGESKTVNFTWPEPLPNTVVDKEVIPMYDIFQARLR